MNPVIISYEQVVAELEKAVAANGEDFVYKAVPDEHEHLHCVYFDATGAPSCIVGHVLAGLGVPSFSYDDEKNGCGVSMLRSLEILDFTDIDASGYSRTMTLLAEAQELQDQGEEWGTAVKYAKEVVDGPAEQGVKT